MKILNDIYLFCHRVHLVARRERGRLFTCHGKIALTTWMPLLFMYLIYAIFSGGIPRDLAIGIVDNDHSTLSRNLIRYIDASPTFKITTQLMSVTEGKPSMQNGDIYAIVTIPRDFEKNVYLGKTPEVTTFYNAQYVLIGRIIAANMQSTFATFTAKIDAAKTLASGGNLARIKGDILPISTQINPLYNVSMNYVPFLVTTVLPALWQIFVITTVIVTFGREYKFHTQDEWLAQADGSYMAAIVGKMLPYTFLALMQGLIFAWFFYVYKGWAMNGNWSYLAFAMTLAVLAGQCVSLLIFCMSMNFTKAISMGAAYSAPAFAFAGITFPAEGMPPLAQFWRELLPITHYIDLQIGQVNYGQSIIMMLPELGALCLFIATIFISAYRIKLYDKSHQVKPEVEG